MKKKWIIGIIITVLLIGTTILSYLFYINHENDKKQALEKEKQEKEQQKLLSEINEAYNKTVKTNKNAKVYTKEKDTFKESGVIAENIALNLEDITPTYKDEYLKIIDFDKTFYISYKDVTKSDNTTYDERYKNYIPFNESVEINGLTKFYDKSGKQLYELNIKGTYPIYVKDSDKYYIEFNNQLLYVNKSDVKVVNKNNSNKGYAQKMSVITYHFFYDSRKGETCDGEICMDIKNFEKQLDYLKEQNFFTPKMEEFDWFMDKKVQLPEKSVMITIDDGWMASPGLETLKKYKMNATIFLITASYDKIWTSNEYVEAQSHTHNLHKQYLCPGYASQGSGLLCLDKNKLLEDFKKSQEALGGAIALCYPFYEYNDYTKSVVKEAGFHLAFAGGVTKAIAGTDKYQVPRYTIVSYHSFEDFKQIVN